MSTSRPARSIFVIMSLLLASNISSASNPVKTPELKCRAGNSARPAEMPKMTEAIGDTIIMVCGFEIEQKSSEGRVFSEFTIRSINSSGVVSKAIKRAGALEAYRISKWSDALHLDEVVSTKSGWWPVFGSLLKCKKSKCSLSEEKCILKLLPSADKWYMEELVSYFEGDKIGKVPDDSLITGAFELALTGDKRAISFFSQRPKTLVTDGATEEAYKEACSMIARLKKADCLK